jgi:hypothetical protein
MPTYDDHFFNPPAPLARVTLRNSQDGKYERLKDADFDIESVPADFDRALILPEPYAASEVEEIPHRGKLTRSNASPYGSALRNPHLAPLTGLS